MIIKTFKSEFHITFHDTRWEIKNYGGLYIFGPLFIRRLERLSRIKAYED